MNAIHLILRPWISGVIKPGETGPLHIDRKVADDATVGELVRALAKEHPALAAALFAPGTNDPVSAMAIVLNDRILPHEGLNTKLQDGDTVALVPFLDGG